MKKLLGLVLILAAAGGLVLARRGESPAPPKGTREEVEARPVVPRMPRELRPQGGGGGGIERSSPAPQGARLVAGIDTTSNPLDVEARFAVHGVLRRPADEGQQGLAMDRAALAASLPRREQQLRERRSEDVVQTVSRRAQALGVPAAPELIAERLTRAAWLELDLDRCMLESKDASTCGALRDEMRELGRRFQAETGLSIAEFRTGELAPDAPAFKDVHAAP